MVKPTLSYAMCSLSPRLRIVPRQYTIAFLDVQFDTREETLSVAFQTEYSGQYIFTWELVGRDLKIKVEPRLDSILRFSKGSLTMWINNVDGENLETYSYTVRSR